MVNGLQDAFAETCELPPQCFSNNFVFSIWKVGIQAGRLDIEFLREQTHGDSVESVLVRESKKRLKRRAAAGRLRCPVKLLEVVAQPIRCFIPMGQFFLR
jgi:hypothetical protein